MLTTDVWGILPVALVSAYFVGLSKGGLPAVSMIAVPLLAFWISPLAAAALLLPIYLVSDAYGIWLYRRQYSSRNIAILVPSGLLGVLLGYLVAPHLSVAIMNAAVGGIGLFYCLRLWFFSRPSDVPKKAEIGPGIFWGTLAGVTSFISHAGAPPFQVYVLPQKLPKLHFAGTATITFAILNFAKLPPYFALGQFQEVDVLFIVCLMVTALFGTWSGAKLTRLLPDKQFFAIVQIALFTLSIQLLWRSIAGGW